jgi:hypothetical protein
VVSPEVRRGGVGRQLMQAVAEQLKVMRQHAPTNDHVHLVAENDERLSDLLCRAGATMRDETLHFEGSLLARG